MNDILEIVTNIKLLKISSIGEMETSQIYQLCSQKRNTNLVKITIYARSEEMKHDFE